MMIAGIVVCASVSGALLQPFSAQRLAMVASAVAGIGFLTALFAVWGTEGDGEAVGASAPSPVKPSFKDVLAEIRADPLSRRFTIFVFVSMLAYSAQELILEPYAGLVFGFTLGKSTQLAGFQHGGVLFGMGVVGLLGTYLRGDKTQWMKGSIVFGCAASALALVGLAAAAFANPMLPLTPIVFGLGFANGIFAVSAIGLMMSYAASGRGSREGVRMGVWGASQAMAFAIGGFAGAAGLDFMRHMVSSTSAAFATVFGIEGAIFIGAAMFAMRLGRARSSTLIVSSAWAGSTQ
jgi:BCD family chlorophyll transporter-like MFS transporter